jgi:hypothetical protein
MWVLYSCSYLIQGQIFVPAQALDYIPLPNPVIHRPTMSSGNEKAAVCRMAPMIMMTEPMKIVRLRPSMLPSQIVATAPKKHPSVYAPTLHPCQLTLIKMAMSCHVPVIACMVAAWLSVLPGGGFTLSISGKYRRNDPRVRRPPITP